MKMRKNKLGSEIWGLGLNVTPNRKVPHRFITEQQDSDSCGNTTLWKKHPNDGNEKCAEFVVCFFQVYCRNASVHLFILETSKEKKIWSL